MGFGMSVASGWPYANNLHLAPDRSDNHTNTLSLNFYRPHALSDAQPTVSKHWRHSVWTTILIQMVIEYVFDKVMYYCTDSDNASKLCMESGGLIVVVEKCQVCSEFKMVSCYMLINDIDSLHLFDFEFCKSSIKGHRRHCRW